jgi:hypothetical protein
VFNDRTTTLPRRATASRRRLCRRSASKASDVQPGLQDVARRRIAEIGQ